MKRSLKRKLTISLLSMVLVAFSIMTFLSINIGKQALDKNTKTLLIQSCKEVTTNISTIIKMNMQNVESISVIPRICDPTVSWDIKKDILNSNAKINKYEKIGIANAKGELVYTNGETTDVSGLDYFKKALKGEVVTSNVLKGEKEYERFICIAAPIKNGINIDGVVVAYKSTRFLQDICETSTFLKSGGYYILDDEGTEIADKDSNYVMEKANSQKDSNGAKSSPDIVSVEKSMVEFKEGIGEYNLEGKQRYVAYAPIEEIRCSAGVLIEKDEALGEISFLFKALILTGVIITAIITLILIGFLGTMLKPILFVKEHMENIGDGDFTKSIDGKYLKKKDEIGQMCNTLQKTQNDIGALISEIKDGSNEIENNATNLAALSEELTALTHSVAISINDITEGTGRQALNLSDIVTVVNNFGEKINAVATRISKIDSMSKEINDKAIDSNRDMKILISSINTFNEKFLEFSRNISHMNVDIKNVTDITSLISNIAEQTNLLALNAAIEAARAGEAGRGFSVVAEEIRKLAEGSKTSSQKINEIINNLLKKTNTIVRETENMNLELENQKVNVESSINAFTKISDSVEEITPIVEEISDKFGEIEKDKEEILRTIEDITALAQEVSASSQEISASMEGLSGSSEEVAASSQILTNRTNDMKEKINVFKI